jgi:hypothetical protein
MSVNTNHVCPIVRHRRLNPAAVAASKKLGYFRRAQGIVAGAIKAALGWVEGHNVQIDYRWGIEADVIRKTRRNLSRSRPSADRQGEAVPEAKITRLNEKVATLRQEIQRLNALNVRCYAHEDKQVPMLARWPQVAGAAGWSVTMCKAPSISSITSLSPMR